MLLFRFPVKRLSTPKQEPQESNIKKPAKETPPSQRASRRQKLKQQDEDEDEDKEVEEEEDKEEVLSQSLKKRDKNIKENKAMVANPYNLLSFLHILTNYDLYTEVISLHPLSDVL